MDAPLVEPLYVTLSSVGAGSITWQNRKPTMIKMVDKITVESPSATGIVSIYRDGALVASRSLALYVAAEGPMPLYPGQSIEVRVTNGPLSQQVKATSYSHEVPL